MAALNTSAHGVIFAGDQLKMLLRNNVFANYLGQGWRALMSLAFVPLYIKYLGIEAYGLIGIFAMLQACLNLLDMGMKPALGREMARFTGGACGVQAIRDLLRSIEVITCGMVLLIVAGSWATADLLVAWVQAVRLPVEQVRHGFVLMGMVIALQFVESLYNSCLAGLQRQVLQNTLTSAVVTLRAFGAVGVLVWFSPTIDAFFLWQGLVSLLSAALLAWQVYRILPKPSHPVRFSLPALLEIWHYALGMFGITILALVLTQVDKLLLSRMLTLEAFGYYALAGVISGALYMLTYPIQNAFYPRFTELLAMGDVEALQHTYHQGAQFVTVLMGAAACILMGYADQVLLLWTDDARLTREVAPLMVVLVLGTLLNGLVGMPHQMQNAYGWTSLTIISNGVAVAVFIPAILWVVPRYGAIGAAWIWVALNAGYMFIGMHFMHRRILTADKWRWYRTDVMLPLLAACATLMLCLRVMPEAKGKMGEGAVVLGSSLLVLMAAALSAPMIRAALFAQTSRLRRKLLKA